MCKQAMIIMRPANSSKSINILILVIHPEIHKKHRLYKGQGYQCVIVIINNRHTLSINNIVPKPYISTRTVQVNPYSDNAGYLKWSGQVFDGEHSDKMEGCKGNHSAANIKENKIIKYHLVTPILSGFH